MGCYYCTFIITIIKVNICDSLKYLFLALVHCAEMLLF